jgi:large subunit ribosomal protein L13
MPRFQTEIRASSEMNPLQTTYQRSLNATEQFEKNPNSIIEKSVKGMLPKNKLGADLFRNLHVFADSDHKFEAQKPSSIDLNKVN